MKLDRKWLFLLPLLSLLFVFCFLCGSAIPSAQAQYQKRASSVKDVPYVFNGQQFVFRLLGSDVRQVLLNGQIILMLANGTVVPYPGIDAHLVASAEDALKAYQAGTTSGSTAVAPAGSSAKAAMTVDDVIKMLDAGLSEDIILAKIHSSGQSFDLSTDDLVRLKKAKASDAVMKAMMEPKSAPVSVAPPTGQPATVAPNTTASQANQAPAAPADAPKKKTGFWGSVGQGVKDDVQGKTVIDKVGLRNVLPQWDPHKPLSEQFPHVAITVLYAPMGWTDPYLTDPNVGGHNLLPPCFKLQAVVWTDAQTSKKVGPFDWCSNHDEMISRLEPTYLYSLQPGRVERGYLTGINRTDGPAPPDTMLPNDRVTMDMEAKTNPHGESKDLNLDATSRFAIMFANVRRDLGETLNADGDYRVWIVSIKKAAGPSLF
jgi:hypothetical protein